MSSEHVWKTREGQLLTLEEIGDSHLLNIIKLLWRRYHETLHTGYSAMCMLQGEHALDAAESGMDEELARIEERAEFFEAEATNRNLTFSRI